MKTFKSNYQQVAEILERENTKEIKEHFHSDQFNCSTYSDNTSILLELVIENSNDFTKDIATRMNDAEGEKYFSAKQAWCVAYQIVNNIEVYKLALVKEIEKATNLN